MKTHASSEICKTHYVNVGNLNAEYKYFLYGWKKENLWFSQGTKVQPNLASWSEAHIMHLWIYGMT